MRITAHLLPGMKVRGFGRIVFVGSIAASLGAVHQVPYTTAKSALHGLVKSLALECASFGVTCNLVEPGLVLTDRVLARLPEERRKELLGDTPMGRAGTPEEIAAVVAFLASPRASYVTGACVPVTGGLGLGLG
jgi:3-oxoacyl-[acyl-carrier protein] reductase